MDESDHLTLVNAGDEEVVSQEEGGREGSAAGGEEGGVGEATRTYVVNWGFFVSGSCAPHRHL